MENEEDFININLDDVDSQKDPMPDGPMLYRVSKAENKHKEGSDYPCLHVELRPQDPKYDKRRYMLFLTHHPSMLFQLKQFVEACRVPWTKKGFNKRDLIDKLVYVSSTIKEDDRSPGDKVNELCRPFNPAN